MYRIIFYVILIQGFLTIQVNAFETYGGSWSNSDVRDLDWMVKSGIDYYWDVRDAVTDATASWQNCVESDCPDFNRVTSNEEVYIRDSDIQQGYLAATLNNPDWTSTYTYSTIWVNEYWQDEGYYENPTHLQSVLAHELGHTLGLAHENDWGAIVLMYWTDASFLDCGIYEPTTDDLNGVDDIYG